MTERATQRVVEHLSMTKQGVFDSAGSGRVSQTGAVVLDAAFTLPIIDASVRHSLPSIETFVASGPDAPIAPMGTNDALNSAWLPAVQRLSHRVFSWLSSHQLQLDGPAYITASITSAAEVNGEAHFDDDQFIALSGAGVVAIVGDRDGSRVANESIEHEDVRAPHPLIADEPMKTAFAEGEITHDVFGPNELIVFPQFGQLHSGPGPCGSTDEVRHLLVLRASTVPQTITG